MADREDPEGEIARSKLVQEFKAITLVDDIVAKRHLVMSQWSIDGALNLYYSGALTGTSSEGLTMNPGEPGTAGNSILIDDESGPEVDSSPTADQNINASFKLLTWNIDGLDERNLIERTRYVCEFINNRQPDAVFLQEVVEETLSIIKRRCQGFSTIHGNPLPGYFNVMMLRKETIKASEPHQCLFFNTSSMGRHLLIQKVRFRDQATLVLMTSHLESTAACSQTRMEQLKMLFIKMFMQDSECTVIYGGDSNLRDHEVTKVGLPPEIVDAWEMNGREESTKYTWDVSVNDNLDWQFKHRPKLRFDRVYVRPGQGQSKLVPSSFSLVGKKHLACWRYPSDHWGIKCEFVKDDAYKPSAI